MPITFQAKNEYSHGLTTGYTSGELLDQIVGYLTGSLGDSDVICTIVNDSRLARPSGDYVELQVGTSNLRLLLCAVENDSTTYPAENLVQLTQTGAVNGVFWAIAEDVTANADPFTSGGPWAIGDRAKATNLGRMFSNTSDLSGFSFLQASYSAESFMLTLYGTGDGAYGLVVGKLLEKPNGTYSGLGWSNNSTDTSSHWLLVQNRQFMVGLVYGADNDDEMMLEPIAGLWSVSLSDTNNGFRRAPDTYEVGRGGSVLPGIGIRITFNNSDALAVGVVRACSAAGRSVAVRQFNIDGTKAGIAHSLDYAGNWGALWWRDEE